MKPRITLISLLRMVYILTMSKLRSEGRPQPANAMMLDPAGASCSPAASAEQISLFFLLLLHPPPPILRPKTVVKEVLLAPLFKVT